MYLKILNEILFLLLIPIYMQSVIEIGTRGMGLYSCRKSAAYEIY